MNNSDMPAMPLTGDAYTDINGGQYCEGRVEDGMGLTKREHFAGLAMQGLIAADNKGAHRIAHDAVNLADALLAELDKEST